MTFLSNMTNKLTPHFSLREMTATSCGLPNVPTIEAYIHLVYLCRALERARRKVNDALYPIDASFTIPINSGYRSPAVNDKLRELGYNSSPTSLHMQGRACDIDISSMSDIEVEHLINALYDEFPSEIYTKGTSYIHFAI